MESPSGPVGWEAGEGGWRGGGGGVLYVTCTQGLFCEDGGWMFRDTVRLQRPRGLFTRRFGYTDGVNSTGQLL